MYTINKAGVILIQGGAIYLVCGRRHYKWGLPKGSIERGETHAECAKREMFEETGLEVVLGRSMQIENAMFFLCNDYRRVARIRPDREEISNSKWFNINELPDEKSMSRHLRVFLRRMTRDDVIGRPRRMTRDDVIHVSKFKIGKINSEYHNNTSNTRVSNKYHSTYYNHNEQHEHERGESI